MRKTSGFTTSGIAAAIIVSTALVGTWFLASFVTENRARSAQLDTVTEVISAPSAIRREPLPTVVDCQPAPVQIPVVSKAARALPDPTGSTRDEHFKNVLESLASRQRQESFEAIYNSNSWGCASFRPAYASSRLLADTKITVFRQQRLD
jgi:hypothetical protein